MHQPAREALDLLLQTIDPVGLLPKPGLHDVEHDSREADREKERHLVLFRGKGGLTPGLLATTNRRDGA